MTDRLTYVVVAAVIVGMFAVLAYAWWEVRPKRRARLRELGEWTAADDAAFEAWKASRRRDNNDGGIAA